MELRRVQNSLYGRSPKCLYALRLFHYPNIPLKLDIKVMCKHRYYILEAWCILILLKNETITRISLPHFFPCLHIYMVSHTHPTCFKIAQNQLLPGNVLPHLVDQFWVDRCDVHQGESFHGE